MPALAERIKTYSGEDKVENAELNRIQDDGLLNSDQLEGLNQDLHYPHVATSDNKLAYTTAADKVTITGGQVLSVGGIRFHTSDLANLEQTIPDSFDGYLRVAVASDCGDVVDAGADPIVRKLNVTFSQTTGSEADPEGTGGGPSSPESARLFHITKGAGGSTPTVTAYANTGHSHISSNPAAEDVSYDNSTASLPSSPADVQAALDALALSTAKGIKVYSTSGSFTFGTDCPSDVRKITVIGLGAGGGGGATDGNGNRTGGGGGGGGCFIKIIDVSTGYTSTITIGAKGAGGTAGLNAGLAGGNSIWNDGALLLTANGGTGGGASGYGATSNGLGGSATNGDVNIAGGPGLGYGGQGNNNDESKGGDGAGPYGGFGGKTDSQGNSSYAGVNSTGKGAGGSGASDGLSGGTAQAGGDGEDGLLVVLW